MAPKRGPTPSSTTSPPAGRDHAGQQARTQAETGKADQAVQQGTQEGLARRERTAREQGNKA